MRYYEVAGPGSADRYAYAEEAIAGLVLRSGVQHTVVAPADLARDLRAGVELHRGDWVARVVSS